MGKQKNEIPIRVGISSCLTGLEVRYDGGHKRDRYLTDVLADYFEFVTVCPEVEAGMGVPRESVRLIGDPEAPRMVGNKTGEDWTVRMRAYTAKRTGELASGQLSGFIFKKDSPSCGMERVKIYSETGMAVRKARGLWGAAVLKMNPLLPVEEEGRLNDLPLRDNFIVRVFAYNRLLNLFNGAYARGEVVDFHARHKYLLLSHSPKHYKLLGQLVADIKKYSPTQLRNEYTTLFMEALQLRATVKKNVNVLLHVLGYLKTYLDTREKTDILKVIEDYHRKLVPLIVPITLLRHYINKFEIEYIQNQYYLQPHPKELMLRNHV